MDEPRLNSDGGPELPRSGFWLKKWYLDAADERGNVYIGYWGEVRWKTLSLHYYEHLWRSGVGKLASKAAFSSRPEPAWADDRRLCWDMPEVRAEWISVGEAPLSERLLTTDHGEIRWRCLQPKARAVIKLPNLAFEGWGYTECLELTVRPWKFPWKRLYWGRSHSDHHYLVWIRWDGPASQSRLWHDGRCTTQFELSQAGLSSGAIALQIQEHDTLRQGLIRSTVFHSLGKVASLVPTRALLVDEHKWFGRGRIMADGLSEPATAIYEEVLW